MPQTVHKTVWGTFNGGSRSCSWLEQAGYLQLPLISVPPPTKVLLPTLQLPPERGVLEMLIWVGL